MDARRGRARCAGSGRRRLAGGRLGGGRPRARRALQIVIVVDGLRPDQVTRGADAAAARAGRPRGAFHRPSRRVPDGDARERRHLRHRRAAGAARPARQLDLHPVGRSGAADRHRRPRGAAEGGRRGGAVAHRADARPDAGAGRQAASWWSARARRARRCSSARPPDAGIILHTEFARPDAWHDKAVAMLGPTPAAGLPNAARNRYATDLLLRIGLPEVPTRRRVRLVQRPRHDRARPRTRRRRDARRARRRGRRDRPHRRLAARAGAARRHQPPGDLGPRVFDAHRRLRPAGAGEAVRAADARRHARHRDGGRRDSLPRRAGRRARRPPSSRRCSRQPAVGAIFTRARDAGLTTGYVRGTLSFDLIGWGHPRAARSSSRPRGASDEAAGLRGTSTANRAAPVTAAPVPTR